jgi:hypothetical protein
MGQYFFDRVSETRAEYDYRGFPFATPEKARQLAELIAIDLGIEGEGSWCGWFIDVRNAYGEKFFSIPVRGPDLVAA